MPPKSPIFNIAHRGARSLAPENTMHAFIKAWQVGAHGIETDLSVSSDGVLMLFHDKTFRRTTNVARVYPERESNALHTFSWEEIQQLDAGSWFIDTDPFGTIADGTIPQDEVTTFAETAIPTLEELLEFIREKKLFLNLEIKALPKENASFPVVEKVLASIERAQLQPPAFSISSYYHPFIEHVRKLHPEIEINALIGEDTSIPQDWGEFEFEIYNANIDLLDDSQLNRAKEKGCQVNLYTVNGLVDMHRYLSMGVKKIITDFPQLLKD